MNETERARFRADILARLEDLAAEDTLGRGAQSVVSLDQQSVGRLSRQDALLNQSMAKASQSRRDRLRTALHAALDRLNHGTFGECEDCGEEIAHKRLELDPTATRCIECAFG
ncbi:TraR/DksA family transcriptional regulator [Marivita sp. S2033]|uniref:TraR/DksA family transcriptional regulator n=1 Tax=Marivita sp. S2033 TaxID=3373187 RepID=UPI0039824998